MKIGVLGGGQLARMLALAGHPLGLEFVVLCPSPEACAASVADHILAGFDDEAALAQLAEQSDIITYEFENVPGSAVAYLQSHATVYPPLDALLTGRDRLTEKTLFNELGISTAPFARVDDLDSLQQAVEQIGLPAILKTRTEGYDGKGQYVLRDAADTEAAWQAIGRKAAILEGFVAFEREVSIVAARSVSGEIAFYPLSENVHREGILRRSTALVNDPLQSLAESHATRLLEKLDYVGVLAIEFFQHGDQLLVNEYAPRVHNSGHWTIEGAETSQFENHLRAILDLPLGGTELVGRSVMLNLIGDIPETAKVLEVPQAHLHLYGKSARASRKVGHITLRTPDGDGLAEKAERLEALLP